MEGVYAGFAGAKTGHRGPAFHRCFLFSLLEGFGFRALAPFRRCHRGAVATVRGKYAMEAGQIDPGLGHQGGELRWNYVDTLPFALFPFRVRLSKWLGFQGSSFQASRAT